MIHIHSSNHNMLFFFCQQNVNITFGHESIITTVSYKLLLKGLK